MTRLNEREIRDLLTPKGAPTPPDGLAERIKSEIPAELEAAPMGDAIRFRRPSPMRRYLMAAAVAMAFGGAFFAYRVQREMTLDGALRVESDAVEDAASETIAAAETPVSAPVEKMPAAGAEVTPAFDEPDESEIPTPQRDQVLQQQTASLERLRTRAAKETAERVHDARPPVPDQALEKKLEVERSTADAESAGELRSVDYVAARPRYEPATASRFSAETDDAALSIFAIDVDPTSYDVVRRSLREGRWPPPEVVRVGALINAFDYGDPPPRRGDVVIHAEGAPAPFGAGERQHLRFHLRAPELEAGTPEAVATGARVQVRFDTETVARYRLVGHDDHEVAGEVLRDLLIAPGGLGRGHAVTLLYEIELRRPLKRGDEVATLRLRHGSTIEEREAEIVRHVTGRDFAGSWDEASAALRLTGLVAELGEILGRSREAPAGDLDEVARRIRGVTAEFPDNADVAELAVLVGRAAGDPR